MTRSRAPFQPLDKDPIDREIERLAKEKGVAAMVAPEPHRFAAPASAAADARQPTAARARMKSLNLELPDYVWTELKIM